MNLKKMFLQRKGITRTSEFIIIMEVGLTMTLLQVRGLQGTHLFLQGLMVKIVDGILKGLLRVIALYIIQLIKGLRGRLKQPHINHI